MPGILPMKVIKVGNSSQSRVAQACDRCRSKKIRCDGIRPCCSQCANVGFECKTSDKLSRRAFPRGYTESLEDRVRSLEAEVKELKCLLDEKDEKIDVLAKLQSFSRPSRKEVAPLSPIASSSAGDSRSSSTHNDRDRDDLIHVQRTSSLLRKPTQDTPFTGPSSTRAFIDAFSSKLERSGRSSAAVSTESLLSPPSLSAWRCQNSTHPKTPPRLVSDQLLNIFFQEWAPLYPVVHRPTILKLYGRYTTNPDSIEDNKYALAQLNLIFGIAAISSTARVPQDPSFFEQNWTPKLEALENDISLSALQCYILAQMYFTVKSDYKKLLRYRGLAVSICLQLGLHQSQKRFSFNPLIGETRKKVFWCQYTVDRFTAALTGLPVLIAESDICTEYPADIDDENVTETGFVPTPPEESTRMSSALAMFSASKILNKVLEKLYPSPEGYEIPLSTVHSLAEDLDDWLNKLPSYLRLEFVQDKPSPNVTNSRSPLLSIVYYFIRSLIRRPAVCFGKPNSASPSMLSLVDSGKHIIQLLKLLDERRLNLSISINKRELIFVTGLGLLWQSIDLCPESKLVREGQKVLSTAITLLESESVEAAIEFGTIINTISPIDGPMRNSSANPQFNQDLSAQLARLKSPKRKFEASRTRFSFSPESDNSNSTQSLNDMRRASTAMGMPSPELSRSVRSSSSHSISSAENHDQSRKIWAAPAEPLPEAALNLDYLPMGGENEDKEHRFNAGVGMSEWEHVLTDMDSGHSNIFTGIYGGSECGQAPAAFATLGSNYHPPTQAHGQTQGQQQHQQRQQPSSLPLLQTTPQNLHKWSPEPWSSTSSNSLHHQQHNSAAVPVTTSTTSQTNPNYIEDRQLTSRDGEMANNSNNGVNAQHQQHRHHHPHHNNNPRAARLDPYEAIVIPNSLDTMDETNDFSVPDTWVPQCVM